MALTLTPERVGNDWVMVDTIKAPSRTATVNHSTSVRRGSNRMA